MEKRWTVATFGDLVTLSQGLCFNAKTNHLMSETGIPLLRIADLINNTQTKFVDAERVPKKYIASPQDIIYTRTGQVGLVFKGKVGVVHNNCFRVIPNERLKPDYVYWYLRQPSVIEKAKALAGGAAQPDLAHDAFKSISLTYPDLDTQAAIVNILSSYEELIENSQRRIKILEAMARGLYREWFVHFRFPGHENHPRVASALGEIPEGWEVIAFDVLLASMTGGDWGSEQPEDRDTSEVTVVRGTDFDEVAYGGYIRAPVRYIKPSSLVSRGLKVGDVIIENSINAKSRSVGTTLLVDSSVLNRLGRDAIAASFCKVLRLHDPQLAPLVHLRTRQLREDAKMEYYQNVATNGIANFQAQKFAKEERLILPTDEVMRAKLIAPISSLFQSVGILASQLSNLRRTRDLLLPRLLSGQINVEAP